MEISLTDINQWQGLIGAGLGPFLAVIFSALGFLIKSWIDHNNEKKESLRRVEVFVTASLNDIYNVRAQLKYFANKMLRNLISEVESIKDPKHFSLESVNFPAFLDIYRYPEAYKLKIRSYYIHNNIMFADAGIKGTNKILESLKLDFEKLMRKNELLIGLMQNHPNPGLQRQGYIENLTLFSAGIEDYANNRLKKPIEMLMKMKVYNELLRKPYGRGYWTWWKMEGTRLKFFLNKNDQRKFARNLDSFDRIDARINDEVQKSLEEAENRASKIEV